MEYSLVKLGHIMEILMFFTTDENVRLAKLEELGFETENKNECNIEPTGFLDIFFVIQRNGLLMTSYPQIRLKIHFQ